MRALGAGPQRGKMSQVKVLPTNPKPPIVGYNYHAFPLAILSVHRAYLDWFYCQYIQLFCSEFFPDSGPTSREPERGKFDFYRHPVYQQYLCPYLDIQWVNQDLVNAAYDDDIVPFVVQSVGQDYYVQLIVDEYYVPAARAYRRAHFSHDILVVGFDRRRQLLRVLGYNSSNKFGPFDLRFSDLRRAYGARKDRPAKVWLARYEPAAAFEFDVDLVKEQLGEFVHCLNPCLRHREIEQNPGKLAGGNVYGLATYEVLREKCLSGGAAAKGLDIRPFHILMEHKRCMVGRLRYMVDKGHLPPGEGFVQAYQRMETTAAVLRMMMIKYRLQPRPQLLARAAARLRALEEAERGTVRQIIGAL